MNDDYADPKLDDDASALGDSPEEVGVNTEDLGAEVGLAPLETPDGEPLELGGEQFASESSNDEGFGEDAS